MKNGQLAWLTGAALILGLGIGCGDDGRPPILTDSGTGDSSTGDSSTGDSSADTGIRPPDGCPMGLTGCGDTCVDTRYDPAHCGGCDVSCGDDLCNAGTCATGCGVGTVECGGRCVDTMVDPSNCGDCDVTCSSGQLCGTGSCVFECPTGTTECSGSCVDTNANVSHCGGCGIACDAGLACFAGACGMRPTVDDDGDTISDFDEQRSIPRDTDGDGTPDYMDDDSDGDGITDAVEAGDTEVMTPPVDTDGDGTPDFQDLDADNDGVADADEVTLGTDPTDSDSDGDGESDGVEVAGGTDPLDAMSNLASRGDFTFDLVPGGMARTDTLQFNPQIRKADVVFLVDTTGSMGGIITSLRASLTALVADIRTAIPDTAFGVAEHRDFPISPYGSSGDRPFELFQRVTTVDADVTAAVGRYAARGGNDGPESQIESLFQAARGDGFRSSTGTVWTAPFVPATGFDATRGHGMIGGSGFRRDALPIVILATDISFHRKWGDTTVVAGDPATWCGENATRPCDAYSASSFGAMADQQPKTVTETLTALNDIGAKVLGLAVRETGTAGRDARAEVSAFAVRTGAYTDPDPMLTPAGCGTGIDGARRDPEMWDPDGAGPLPSRSICPLVFSADGAGTGTRAGIVNAIQSLTSFVSFTTLHTEARDDPATAVDESQFFVRGIPVSWDTMTCAPAPNLADRLDPSGALGMDGTVDSFTDVTPGCLVTFQIVAQNDGFVPATCADQLFDMRVIVVGDDIVEADSRTVIVRIPGDRTLCTP